MSIKSAYNEKEFHSLEQKWGRHLFFDLRFEVEIQNAMSDSLD